MERILKEAKILAIIRGDFPQIEKTVKALFEGGIRTVEVTMNSPKVEKILPKILKEFGQEMLVGAGTVINADDCQKALSLGAQFIIAPNLNSEVVNLCQKKKKLVIPGVLTPSEISQALNLGINFLKLFPASSLGANYLKELKKPFDQVSFMAVGGINLENANEFIQAGAEVLGIGGGLIDRKAIEKKRFKAIKKRAALFLKLFKKRNGSFNH